MPSIRLNRYSASSGLSVPENSRVSGEGQHLADLPIVTVDVNALRGVPLQRRIRRSQPREPEYCRPRGRGSSPARDKRHSWIRTPTSRQCRLARPPRNFEQRILPHSRTTDPRRGRRMIWPAANSTNEKTPPPNARMNLLYFDGSCVPSTASTIARSLSVAIQEVEELKPRRKRPTCACRADRLNMRFELFDLHDASTILPTQSQTRSTPPATVQWRNQPQSATNLPLRR